MTAADIAVRMSNYTVQRTLERDDFSNRYKQQKPITMLEFLYPLLQGYDSVALKADIELGGTDQKFNLLVGRDIQQAYGQESQVVITMPLLEGLDGVNKMSKSLGNYVGINEPAKEIFGKIMSVSDELMWKYYELLTDIPLSEITAMRESCRENKMNPRDAKAKLAREIVTLYHGADDAEKSEKEFENVFKNKGVPENIPSYELDGQDQSLWDIIYKAGLADSASAAKRLIQQGGVSIDGEKVPERHSINRPKNGSIIRVGKRGFVKVYKKSKKSG